MPEDYLNPDITLEKRIENLLQQLTLNEKFKLLAGHTNFSTYPIKRLQVPEFGMTDGPHGVGKHSAFNTKNTYFPAAIGLAAAWNPEMSRIYGESLAEETRGAGRHAILAPGVNLCRTPLNGRTFEYFSEDPYLAAQMAIPLIKGVQSKRVAACIKHFYCNSQEVARRWSNSVVDERTLEELYWRPFKDAIKAADPWMLMGSYNRINDKWVYENPPIGYDMLCKQWGFQNCMVTDWFASHHLQDPAICIKSRLSLEMPKAIVYDVNLLKKAYDAKGFSDEELNDCIRRLLRVMFLVGLFDPAEKIPLGSRNTDAHLEVARKMAEESIVLIKNEKNLLPIKTPITRRYYLAGDLIDYHFYVKGWGGSSAVVPPTFSTIKRVLAAKITDHIKFVNDPKNADVAIIATGWTHRFFNDAEGQDRKSLRLTKKREKQILEVAKKCKKTVVVLFGGSACDMTPWIDQVNSVLCVWQPHQEGGNAIANILLGNTCPSGKLPISFPRKLEDSPVHMHDNPPGRTYPKMKYTLLKSAKYEGTYMMKSQQHKDKLFDIHYDEGLYIGYRHFDKKQIEPLFPFGYGLSYTTFTIENIQTNANQITLKDKLSINATIKNTGKYAGAEVVQVYFHDVECRVDRPTKELCAFQKVFLKPGEEKTISIAVDPDRFQYYDVEKKCWTIEPGEIKLLVGTSSKAIIAEIPIQMK
jgi:beta-glucosidase